MGERLLTVKNLKTYFSLASGTVKAVDGVSFTLDKGEILGIVGESGCGKSVTASSIIRLLPPKIGNIVDGEINFEGRDVRALSGKELLKFRGRDISMIFQNPMTFMRCSQWFWNRILPDPAVYHDHVHDACSERRSLCIHQCKGNFQPESGVCQHFKRLSGENLR